MERKAVSKMKKPILTALVLTLVRLTVIGQEYNVFVVKLINETGQPIEVVLTHYNLDSIAHISKLKFTDERWKTSPGYFRGIRLDIVALNGNDTVFSKSVKHVNAGKPTVRIKNGIHDLDEPIKVMPRLRISGSNRPTGRVFSIGKYAGFKLHSGKKVRGYVKSYTKASLTIETKKEKTIVIAKEDLKAFRERRSLFEWGPRFSLFPYIKYEELLDIQFEFVEWDNTGGVIGRGGWEAIK